MSAPTGAGALLLAASLTLAAPSSSSAQPSTPGRQGSYARALELAEDDHLEDARREALLIPDELLRAQALVFVHFRASDYAGALPAVDAAFAEAAPTEAASTDATGPPTDGAESADAPAYAWLAERGVAAALYGEAEDAAQVNLERLEATIARLPADQRFAWQEARAAHATALVALGERAEARARAVQRARRAVLGLCAVWLVWLALAARRI